jgi:two-component system, NarL family, nitrate/nitrite response regulator NarL
VTPEPNVVVAMEARVATVVDPHRRGGATVTLGEKFEDPWRGGGRSSQRKGVVSAPVEAPQRPRGIPERILLAGSDLLADALASALQTYGFATMNVASSAVATQGGIDWGPDLAVVDARSLDLGTGSMLIGELRRAGIEVCVIDSAEEDDRLKVWRRAGSAALIDKREPFDQLFNTITSLLRRRPSSDSLHRSGPSLTSAQLDSPNRGRLAPFATLTEREQVVLAELIEGHPAEDIARAGYVSISTVRSQIKAILQKLGVNSQLAAVAMARRAGWSLERPLETPPEPTNGRRRRVS